MPTTDPDEFGPPVTTTEYAFRLRDGTFLDFSTEQDRDQRRADFDRVEWQTTPFARQVRTQTTEWTQDGPTGNPDPGHIDPPLTPRPDTTATQATGDPAQGTHFYSLTYLAPSPQDAIQVGTYTPPPGATRYDSYLALRDDLADRIPHLRDVAIIDFTLDLNSL